MGLLYACAVGQDPEGGHGQGQQVPGHAHLIATAAGQNGPAHLQGQALELAGPQVRQVLGEALRMGIECGRKKHGWPQVLVSPSIQGTAMLFLLPEPFCTPGLPLPTLV